jgi:hypothetical protein
MTQIRYPRISLLGRGYDVGLFNAPSVCFSSDGQPASSPFPSAPPRTVLARFPGTRLSSDQILRSSAFSISLTWLPHVLVHLSSFAMWPAFPASDYYDDSVTMGLAPCR